MFKNNTNGYVITIGTQNSPATGMNSGTTAW